MNFCKKCGRRFQYWELWRVVGYLFAALGLVFMARHLMNEKGDAE